MDTVSKKLASISYFIGWLFHGWINMFHVLFFPKVFLINNNAILLTVENFAQHEICSEKSNTIKTVQNQKTFKSYRWNYEMNHLKRPFENIWLQTTLLKPPPLSFVKERVVTFLILPKWKWKVRFFPGGRKCWNTRSHFKKERTLFDNGTFTYNNNLNQKLMLLQSFLLLLHFFIVFLRTVLIKLINSYVTPASE